MTVTVTVPLPFDVAIEIKNYVETLIAKGEIKNQTAWFKAAVLEKWDREKPTGAL